jgi:hypothetical protein
MLTKDLQRITVNYSDLTIHDILLYSVAVLIKGYYHGYEFEKCKSTLHLISPDLLLDNKIFCS